MVEREENAISISFQWVVGDFRPLEKNLTNLMWGGNEYGIMVLSRLVAYGLTVAVAYLLLPNVELMTVLLIALVGSLSIWVSLGLTIIASRTIERLIAADPSKVGWNSVWLDAAGISWSTEITQQYISWLGVSEVVERDRSLWFKTGRAHGYYLPPRVFGSEQELRDCQALIEQFRANPLPPSHISEPEAAMVKH